LRSYIAVLLCAIAIMTTSTVSVAHHSHGNYDVRNYTHLSGTVSQVIWLNPHVWVHIDTATPDGDTETWALEGGSVNEVIKRGWQKDSLKVGDKIDVRCHALRDGAKGCLLGFIKPEGGEERVFD